MPQVLRPENIGTISKISNSTFTIGASVANIGGQQRTTTSVITVATNVSGANGIDTGAIAANQFYYIYLVNNNGTVAGVISLSGSAPTGFLAYKLVGQCTTDGSSNLVAANKSDVDNAPIGQVMAAMLDESTFRAVHGAGWILADGRSVTGSKYASISGNTTAPDLRGQVLRGKNNGRADGNQDPSGERTLGNFQTHATAKNGLTATHNIADSGHSHGPGPGGAGITFVTQTGGAGILSSGGAYGQQSSTSTSLANITGSVTLGAGDAETRMRNVAVNHFIKIN